MKTGYTAPKPVVAKGYAGSSLSDMPETFSLTDKQLPAIKTWKIGQTYDITISAKLVSQSKDSGDTNMRGRFEITSADEAADDSEDD